MNRFAYRSTSLAIKTISALSRAKVQHHGEDRIPTGPVIFVINHFTRLETLLLPYHLNRITGQPIWSLADAGLFNTGLSAFFDRVGVVSTSNPHRDRLIVKSLLSGEASWIIFPEGRMVKSKKIIEKGRYMIAFAGGKHPPHTGAAALALRTEFYRQRLARMREDGNPELERLCDKFGIEDLAPVMDARTHIVPVNLTYYPIRARENVLSRLAARIRGDLPERFVEELMTEGSMLIEGVDLDIRFGTPIDPTPLLAHERIQKDICCSDTIEFDDPIPSLREMRQCALRLMQRYMQSIYSMTTVNHDHLFASFLRLTPFARMDEYGLKLRTYLASRITWDEIGVRVHNTLKADQMHLLVDDLFGKYRDFIELAADTRAVTRQDGTLERAPRTFSPAWDFHRVRVDNPVAVIANEVEPLNELIKRIRRIAWTPGFMLRRKVSRMLIEQEELDYLADYRDYYVEGESKQLSVGMPYLVRGRRRDIGVLLIHGYMASPLEVKALADYFGKAGYRVYAPRLKGHGTSPEDLAQRRYQDWIESVNTGYAIIRSTCRRVVLGGFSNGAGLALDLASRVQDALGVFAISPPMQLQDFSAKLVPAVDVWNRLMKKVHIEGARKQFVENNPENPHINYHRNPISGVRELGRLMDQLEPKLADIRMPALVIQAMGDPVVSPDGTRKVYRKLGSRDKTYVVLNYQRHGIILGKKSERVHHIVHDFIQYLKDGQHSPPADRSTP